MRPPQLTVNSIIQILSLLSTLFGKYFLADYFFGLQFRMGYIDQNIQRAILDLFGVAVAFTEPVENVIELLLVGDTFSGGLYDEPLEKN